MVIVLPNIWGSSMSARAAADLSNREKLTSQCSSELKSSLLLLVNYLKNMPFMLPNIFLLVLLRAHSEEAVLRYTMNKLL